MSGAASPSRPRRSELLAATSLAIDLGLGLPMEHMLRSCALGMRLADALDLSAEERSRVFYATLLSWIGCHAESPEIAAVIGDDIDYRAAMARIDRHGLAQARLVLGRVASDRGAWERVGKVAAFAVFGGHRVRDIVRSHCASAGLLATHLGIGDIGPELGFVFERWDGTGLPNGARGEEIPIAMRVVHLTDTAEIYLRDGGATAAVEVVRERAGTHFDPSLAEAMPGLLHEFEAAPEGDALWEEVLAAAPDDRPLGDEELEGMLAAMGDFADLKSPYTAGHSQAVAAIARDAGALYGLDAPRLRELHHAALVHDLGRMGVANTVWDKAGPLTSSELERVRLHPYLTGRVLSRVPGLRHLAGLAASHHERLDGSGYPRGDSASSLGPAHRLLAAADCYQSWREPRPYRAPLSAGEAAERLTAEVSALRLDADAVMAVLRAVGQQASRRTIRPAGLTERELEVLRLLVRGMPSREIASTLSISPKTARNHLEHIYTKLGVSNRVSATLFAVQSGIVGLSPPTEGQLRDRARNASLPPEDGSVAP